MPRKVLSVVGARPQFVKAALVSDAMRLRGLRECLIHTGQHYDHEMSQIFFNELGLRAPDRNLGVGSQSHAGQVAAMLVGIEAAILQEKPDIALVFGDTNSTLAGALAAAKLGIPLAHVEAGLRSFNRAMPEELNRVLTDHASDILFCPTQNAVTQLAREAITRGVHFVGDTMYDATLRFSRQDDTMPAILARLGLTSGRYLALTLHRPGNVDVPERLTAILETLADCDTSVVFPVHPRTMGKIEALPDAGRWLRGHGALQLIKPLGYQDMLALVGQAHCLLTDSGGLQKEAYFLRTPCITLRGETEWTETVDEGWNVLVDAEPERILAALKHRFPETPPPPHYGDGRASRLIADILATTDL